MTNGNDDPSGPDRDTPSAPPGGFGQLQPEVAESGGETRRRGLAWERRAELGPGTAVLRTIGEVLFSPATAFASMKREGGWGEPLGFAVLVGSVSFWVAQLWGMLTRSLMAGAGGLSIDEVASANAAEVWFALMAPLVVCAATFFGAAVVHGLLLLFGGAPHPYETTFRVVCYTWSAGVINVLPICGVYVAAVWRVVAEVIGIREAQEVSTGRAAAAVIIPFVLACICLVLLALVAVAAGGMSAMAM